MPLPKLTRLELEIMETLWTQGACSVREIHRAFASARRPAFTTVQTTIYRLETKKALRRTKQIGNANIFVAVVSRDAAQGSLIDGLVKLFGTRPMIAHLIRSGQLTLDDIRDAENAVHALAGEDKKEDKSRDRKST